MKAKKQTEQSDIEYFKETFLSFDAEQRNDVYEQCLEKFKTCPPSRFIKSLILLNFMVTNLLVYEKN